MYRAKQDGNSDSQPLRRTIPNLTCRTCIIGLEASLGALNVEDIQWIERAAYDAWAKTDGHVASFDSVQIIHVKWNTDQSKISNRCEAYPGLKLCEEGACLTVMFASICLRRLFGWVSLVLAQWRDTPSVLHPMDTSWST